MTGPWPAAVAGGRDRRPCIATVWSVAARELSGPVVVRSARPSDLKAIVECIVGGALVAGNDDPADLEPYHAALAEAQVAPSDVLVAEVDGAVVGTCQLIVFRHLHMRGARCAELESVHVQRELRGRGIGTKLASVAIERARALGCHRVQLTSNLARTDAHRFWEQMGFVRSHAGFKLPLTS